MNKMGWVWPVHHAQPIREQVDIWVTQWQIGCWHGWQALPDLAPVTTVCDGQSYSSPTGTLVPQICSMFWDMGSGIKMCQRILEMQPLLYAITWCCYNTNIRRFGQNMSHTEHHLKQLYTFYCGNEKVQMNDIYQGTCNLHWDYM